jgi:hypothetical protein
MADLSGPFRRSVVNIIVASGSVPLGILADFYALAAGSFAPTGHFPWCSTCQDQRYGRALAAAAGSCSSNPAGENSQMAGRDLPTTEAIAEVVMDHRAR